MSATLSPSTPINRRLAGITTCTVNGIPYPVTEFSWSPGIWKRETMASLSGVDGFSEVPRAAFIALKLRDGQSTSVSGFNDLVNATVVVQLANGKQIVGHNLWNTGEGEVSGTEANFDVRFEGVAGSIREQGVR